MENCPAGNLTQEPVVQIVRIVTGNGGECGLLRGVILKGGAVIEEIGFPFSPLQMQKTVKKLLPDRSIDIASASLKGTFYPASAASSAAA